MSQERGGDFRQLQSILFMLYCWSFGSQWALQSAGCRDVVIARSPRRHAFNYSSMLRTPDPGLNHPEQLQLRSRKCHLFHGRGRRDTGRQDRTGGGGFQLAVKGGGTRKTGVKESQR